MYFYKKNAMKKSDIIVSMTSFVFEDGETYYFEIAKFENLGYYQIDVYRKIVENKRFLFWKWKSSKYSKINFFIPDSPTNLIKRILNKKEIKEKLKELITYWKETTQISGWDGLVGEIPEDMKKSVKRDSILDDLLKNIRNTK